MRKLLDWLTRDDVARSNAARASVRLQHGRRARDEADAFLADNETEGQQPFRRVTSRRAERP